MTEPVIEPAEADPDLTAITEAIARNIRVEAARMGVSLTAVGEGAGLKHPALSKRMAGSVTWSLTDLLAVAKFFNVKLSVITPDLTEDVTR